MQDITDAEEVTQDVFVKVHKELPAFKGASSIDTWVYRIGINMCLDFLRYKNRNKRKGFMVALFKTGNNGAELPLELPDFHHPGIQSEQQQESRILYAALNRINEKQRTAFILCFVEEMPQKEVAAIMNISIKAVESLLQRAKAQLRIILEKEYEYRRVGK